MVYTTDNIRELDRHGHHQFLIQEVTPSSRNEQCCVRRDILSETKRLVKEWCLKNADEMEWNESETKMCVKEPGQIEWNESSFGIQKVNVKNWDRQVFSSVFHHVEGDYVCQWNPETLLKVMSFLCL